MAQKIAKSQLTCSQCKHGFEPGESYRSVLLDAEDGEWKRLDFCENCEIPGEMEPLALWKSTRPVHPAKITLSEDAIWQVMKKAKEDESLRERPVLYILCLMMARKRKLRCIATKRKGANTEFTYENKSRGIHLRVPEPRLRPSMLPKLTEEMEEFFSGDA